MKSEISYFGGSVVRWFGGSETWVTKDGGREW